MAVELVPPLLAPIVPFLLPVPVDSICAAAAAALGDDVVMWIVFVFRVVGVGDMLRLRKLTLTGRLLAATTGEAVSFAFVAFALPRFVSEEMAILVVERADIDFVIMLFVLLLLVWSTLCVDASR